MTPEDRVRQDIVEVGRRIWVRGYVAAYDGNISVRLGDEEIITTPSGCSKGFMKPEDLVKIDLVGKPVGQGTPSSEIALHLMVYRERPDVRAVVHAHPPISTGFGIARKHLDMPTLPEVICHLGSIPLADYATPTTNEVPESVMPYIHDHDAIMLANHGSLTIGKDVFDAYYKLEIVEHFAQITLVARSVGREVPLTSDQIACLQILRQGKP
jgi:L-fuculose-phosphate aldolase